MCAHARVDLTLVSGPVLLFVSFNTLRSLFDLFSARNPQRQWTKTLVHNTLVDAVMRFCKDCGMVDVQSEVKYWDPRRVGSDGSRRVPDVVCFHPHTGVEYVIDVRMFWQVLGGGPGGYTAYVGAGSGAAIGEADKERRWKEAIKSRQDRVAHEVKFVPFCVEVGGAWGSAAKTFFNTCVVLAGDDRDIDLYHWSSERFSAAWRTTISVLVAKGRARVGVAGAATDWPKRIRDLQFLDHEGDPTTM